jgi:Predicted transcriptional regulators
MYYVKEKREACNLTQEELAKKAGVSRQTIISIETDRNFSTSTKTLIRLAQALECKVSDIFLD